MKKNIGKINGERAAVSVLVLITVLTFVFVLLGAFLVVTTLRKSQLNSDIRIQDIYQKGVNNVNEIYQNELSVIENRETSKFRVGDKIYDSIEDLLDGISNAEAGSTVKLVHDLDLTYYPGSGYPVNVLMLPDNSTLDLQGNTIKLNKFGLVFEGKNITIKNGNFETGASYGLWIGDEDETDGVILENINVKGGVNIYNSSNVLLRNLNVIGHTYYAVWGDENTSITIESGNYSTDGIYGLLGMDNSNPAGNLHITGGNYTISNKLMLSSSIAPVITGGTYNKSIDSSYIASGYHLVEENGNYVVRAVE